MAATSFDPLATALRHAATADRDQLATKTDIRWILTILSFQSAIILAMAARLFEIL